MVRQPDGDGVCASHWTRAERPLARGPRSGSSSRAGGHWEKQAGRGDGPQLQASPQSTCRRSRRRLWSRDPGPTGHHAKSFSTVSLS